MGVRYKECSQTPCYRWVIFDDITLVEEYTRKGILTHVTRKRKEGGFTQIDFGGCFNLRIGYPHRSEGGFTRGNGLRIENGFY